jgi:hypothetical protein
MRDGPRGALAPDGPERLYPFATLRATGVADAEGDKAFDEEPCAAERDAGVVGRRRRALGQQAALRVVEPAVQHLGALDGALRERLGARLRVGRLQLGAHVGAVLGVRRSRLAHCASPSRGTTAAASGSMWSSETPSWRRTWASKPHNRAAVVGCATSACSAASRATCSGNCVARCQANHCASASFT